MRDDELLEQFVRDRSNDAFAALVRLHIDRVYNAALRQVRDPGLADDVTQAVFIVLMRKASRLRGSGSIVGWLLKTTYLACRDVQKAERRRSRRERVAAMRRAEVLAAEPVDELAIAELVEAGLSRLAQGDRTALTLSYLEGRSLEEVAEAMGISVHAAAKRVTRAIVRLRNYLLRSEGVDDAIGMIAIFAKLKVESAPAAVVQRVIGLGGGAASSASAMSIAQRTIRSMIMHSTKQAAVVVVTMAIFVAGGLGVRALANAEPSNPPKVASQWSDGWSVNLVGVCEQLPTGGQRWWNPDGSVMANAPTFAEARAAMPKLTVQNPGKVLRRFVLKIDAPAGVTDQPTYRFDVTGGWIPLQSRADGGYQVIDAEVPDVADGASISCQIASGPWQIRTTSGLGQGIGDGRDPTFQVMFGEASDVKGGMQSAVAAMGDHVETLDVSFIGSLSDGSTAPIWAIATSRVPKGRLWTLMGNMRVEQLQSISIRNRVFDRWVEFKKVALHEGAGNAVETSSGDGVAGR